MRRLVVQVHSLAPNNILVAQLVEHSTDNRNVTGSNPVGNTKNGYIAQLVEQALHMGEVGGSNPPIPTK